MPSISRNSFGSISAASSGPLFVSSSDALRSSAADVLSQEEESHSQTKNLSSSTTNSNSNKRALQLRKRQWVEQSVQYYSTIMRNESRRARGQGINPNRESLDTHKKNFTMAKKLYFARNKIKSGNLNHAETIYRKLINELIREIEDEEEEHCDHAQLAVSTLLLALLLQRQKQTTETRDVFVRFFRIIHQNEKEGVECACSAKVVQAFALFEMKEGRKKKSYRLAQMAVKMDPELEPLLSWKQFRDVAETVHSSWSI
jgi:hypothetical protein